MATTTSLYAMPMLRRMKIRPETTGQAASEGSACGIRLMAAVPIGCQINNSSEVSANGI